MSGAEQSPGKMTQKYARRLQKDWWRRTVMAVRKSSNVPKAVGSVSHKAARLLRHLGRQGASVPLSTASWNRNKREASVHRGGPHKSLQRECKFMAAEMLDFCMQGYWLVLPCGAVETLKHVRISPLGVVPQRDWRPRLIVN
jgi:hypothetical protein